jgi:hypothetical protein
MIVIMRMRLRHVHLQKKIQKNPEKKDASELSGRSEQHREKKTGGKKSPQKDYRAGSCVLSTTHACVTRTSVWA